MLLADVCGKIHRETGSNSLRGHVQLAVSVED